MPAVLDQRYCEMGFSAAVTAVSGGPWGVLWALVALCEGRPHGCRDGGGVGWSYGAMRGVGNGMSLWGAPVGGYGELQGAVNGISLWDHPRGGRGGDPMGRSNGWPWG